jgi:hypothetical protein
VSCKKCQGLLTEEFDIMLAGYLVRCMNCGWRGEPEPTVLTDARTLAERQREQRDAVPPDTEAKRQYQASRNRTRYEQGFCRACPRKRLADGVFCRRHRDENRAQARAAYRRKHRVAA